VSAIEIKEETIIAKDISAVWSILTDITSWRLWSNVVDRAAIYGQIKKGTNFKCLIDKWDFDGIIEEAEAPGKFYFRGKTIGINAAMRWELSRTAEGAKILLTVSIDGWLAKLLRGAIKRGFEGAVFTWLFALKNYAERGTVRAEEEKDTGVTGKLPKKKLSVSNPFIMYQPGRRGRDDEN